MLVAPALLVLAFAVVAPILVSLLISLTDWSGLGQYQMVGVANYLRALNDPVVWRSFLNTLLLLAATLFVQHPLAFLVALMLEKLTPRGSRVLRSIFFIPSILTVVVTTKLWVYAFNPNYGLFSKLFHSLGLEDLSRVAWLADPQTALAALIVVMLWQGFGWAILFYYAALMTFPKELREAARMDGASGVQLVWRVMIPYLMPVINSIVIIAIIACLKTMETVFLATGGGPGDRTQFIANYLYQRAFVTNEFGYANSISVVFVVLALGMTVVTNRLAGQGHQE